jgi:hypothetical protein
VTRQRVAFALLAVLAVVFGANLTTAATRFVRAYNAYDRLELNLTSFRYVMPDQPVETTFRVSNPSGESVELIEVELRISVGVHSVGGGQVRPQVTLAPDGSQEIPVALSINDKDYIMRAGTDALDWRVSGRVQVQLNPAIDPVWIPFVVRYLPQ